MTALVLLPVLLPLGTAMLTALSARQQRTQLALSLGGATLSLVVSVILLAELLATGPVVQTLGGWLAPFGIQLAADPLAAVMLVVTAVMTLATLVFQTSDADPAPPHPHLTPLTHALAAAVAGAFLTGDLFNLYVWFELMLVASLGLLALSGTRRALDATLKYFILNAIGTLLLLIGIAHLYAATGHLAYGALSAHAADPEVAAALLPFIALVALAFLVKGGAFPLFSWLPASYPALPSPQLALFAGLLTKVGVYALLRLLIDIFPATPDLFREVLLWVACATMLFGVLGAAYHWDMRRILAFHIVSQIGYMLLALAATDTTAGATATTVYIVHHIIVKANLFFIAAIIYRLTGSFDLRRTGGLYQHRPGLALLFGIPALALVGIPPLSGFWAKLLVIRGALHEGQDLGVIVAVAVGVLTLYSMMKIWFGAFWRPHPDAAWQPPAKTRLAPAYAVTAVLALITLTLGLFPDLLVALAAIASASLGGPS